MTRQIHDQFAKEFLEELLAPLGTIKKSDKVKSEVQEIDVWFEPASSPSRTELPLGLLGKMAATSCLFEPFRNPPSAGEVRSCLLKLYAVHGEVLRKAKRSNTTIPESELPILWILTPTCSSRMIQGGIQKRAVEELVSLPENIPGRDNLLEILANWRKNLELRDNLNSEEQEVIMNLSPAYLKQREEWKQEGRLEGTLEGQLSLIGSLLQGRFGELDSELFSLIEKIGQLPISERTKLLLSLANLSREELVQKFREN